VAEDGGDHGEATVEVARGDSVSERQEGMKPLR